MNAGLAWYYSHHVRLTAALGVGYLTGFANDIDVTAPEYNEGPSAVGYDVWGFLYEVPGTTSLQQAKGAASPAAC